MPIFPGTSLFKNAMIHDVIKERILKKVLKNWSLQPKTFIFFIIEKYWNVKINKFYSWGMCFYCFLNSINSLNYHIVASRNTCYYLENRFLFCFLKSRILACRIIFLGIKLFLFVKIEREDSDLTNLWCVCQVTFFSAHLDNFYLFTSHFINLI